MNTVIIIDGGAGRVITAIPALQRYVLNNPKDNIKIFVYGWDSLLWGDVLLQDKTFNTADKGTFNNHIKNADIIISPEPYRLPDYINQRCSLAEAFDILINGDKGKNNVPSLFLSKGEIINAKNIIKDVKKYQNKDKTIVIQPFGSTAYFYKDDENDEVVDISSRSLSLAFYSKLVYNLSSKYNIVLFADQKFHFKEDIFSYKLNTDLRGFASVIGVADYFIGCDSVGQHMARALNKPGTVIFGSTFPENVSYPDWFDIVDLKKDHRVYSPLRINDIDCQLADRNNEICMDYNDNEIGKICLDIMNKIETQAN